MSSEKHRKREASRYNLPKLVTEDIWKEFHALCVKNGVKMSETLNDWIALAVKKGNLDLR